MTGHSFTLMPPIVRRGGFLNRPLNTGYLSADMTDLRGIQAIQKRDVRFRCYGLPYSASRDAVFAGAHPTTYCCGRSQRTIG